MSQQTSPKPFEPLPWQIPAWRCKDLVMLCTGSAGGGKSRLCAEKLHAISLKYPGAFTLAVRKTRASMTNSTVLFLKQVVIGNDPRVKHVPSASRFEYSNGSILAYGGVKDDEQRERLRSIGIAGGVDAIWIEEAHLATLADYEELLARLRGTAAGFRQLMLSTNPDSDAHWINRLLIKGGGATVFYSTSTENTYNPPAYRDTLSRLTGVRALRLVKGLWVKTEGLVYDDFNSALHVIDPFPIPETWRRFRVIDFGFNNPFVCQWWALSPDNILYMYREIYLTGMIVSDHAQRILELTGKERIEATICDHDAEDAATLRKAGIPNIRAYKPIKDGIEAVVSRLRIGGNNKARLYFFRGALDQVDTTLAEKYEPTCTLDEIGLYVWADPKEGANSKELPVDVHNHGLDAMRYMVAHLDLRRVRRQGSGAVSWL